MLHENIRVRLVDVDLVQEGEVGKAGRANKEIRQKGMEVALAHERSKGRNPIDMSGKRKRGYDIKSGDRKIEVKGQEWKWEKLKSSSLYITENELAEATHLYVVCDVRSSPDLHIFKLSQVPHRAFKVEVKYVLKMARCRDYEIKE